MWTFPGRTKGRRTGDLHRWGPDLERRKTEQNQTHARRLQMKTLSGKEEKRKRVSFFFFLRPLFYKPWLSIYLSQWSSQQHLRALTFWLRGSDSGVMLGQSRRLKE